MEASVNVDILIIGGGINGTGIAADAAGRGLTVLLSEQNDLASGTSSASSKLIHGGLRYLENYEFHLVKEALLEREILLQNVSYLIHPLPFLMPYSSERPAWLVRLGLFLYDYMCRGSSLPRSKSIHFNQYARNNPLKDTYHKGLVYYDCQTDDARLVIANAIAAAHKGARILTRSQFLRTRRLQSHWEVELLQKNTGKIIKVNASALVNAAGPWVDEVLNNIGYGNQPPKLKLVKGSHIVVKQLYPENKAYLLQNVDGRVVFVIPYHNKYSLIGTTDIPFTGNLDQVTASDEEKEYLCACVNRYFKQPISKQHILWSYAGVRPLKNQILKNPAKISRDYELILDSFSKTPPLLSIVGGKVTTYRCLAENAISLLKPFFPHCEKAWTANSSLPGGNLPQNNFEIFLNEIIKEYAWIPSDIVKRYAHQYGSRIYQLLAGCKSITDLGISFGAGLFEREAIFLVKNEWAQTSEDILWRRTKLGLELNEKDLHLLNNWIYQHVKAI